MNVKATTVGFVMAGLVSAGAVTVLVVSQPAPVKQVQLVAPAANVATPTATVVPVVVPTTQAPVPVKSAPAPAPVVAPKEAVVTSQPAPIVHQSTPGTYQDGTPVVRGPSGDVVLMPPPDPGNGNAPQGAFGPGAVTPAVIVTPTTAP